MTQQPLFSRSRCAAILLLAMIALGPLGCASGSSAERDATSERVSGQPPSADEDVVGQLPKGPDILVGSSASGEEVANAAPGDAANLDEAVISRDALNRLIQKGPSFPLSMVEVEAARVDGTFAGYRVLSVAPTAQSTLQGRLKEGDIITHLNGVRVEKPDDYLSAWKLLADLSTLRIDFVRDGAPTFSVWRV